MKTTQEWVTYYLKNPEMLSAFIEDANEQAQRMAECIAALEEETEQQRKGYYQCRICGCAWEGTEVFQDPISTALLLTCGDLTCGGPVTAISPMRIKKLLELPKTAESK